ncbi:hypothetical protein BVX95_00080 [archaeon D22]|nr:hypothetical protein BVX95_00080 [archaeon D22]
MKELRHKSLPFEKTIEIRKILGKEVLTRGGKKLGSVKSIQIDPEDLTVEGIVVDTGLFEANHYIDKNYIKQISQQAVMLKVDPVSEYVGLDVLDSTGAKIGKVKSVNRSRNTNNLISITVEGRKVGGEMMFTSDYIDAVGDSIMLKEKFAKT